MVYAHVTIIAVYMQHSKLLILSLALQSPILHYSHGSKVKYTVKKQSGRRPVDGSDRFILLNS